MREGVTLRDLASPTFVGVSESDSLRDTAELMAAEDVASAVVLRGETPVGEVSSAGILAELAEGADLAGLTVAEAMDDAPPTLPAEDPASAAVSVFANGARQVLVIDGTELIGAVGPRDVLAVAPAAEHRGTEERPATRGQAPMNPSAGDDSGMAGADTRQGICETCGTLTQELIGVDGQLMCPDCRGV